jgi:hypothetical protein
MHPPSAISANPVTTASAARRGDPYLLDPMLVLMAKSSLYVFMVIRRGGFIQRIEATGAGGWGIERSG